MADQSIEGGAAGYVVLPDGRRAPTLDTWINQQVNVPPNMQRQMTTVGQGYKDYVAQPVTDALGNFINTPAVTAEKLNLISPETSSTLQAGGRTAASFAVPQNLTTAGMVAATGIAGGLGAGMAGRIAAGTAGGALGGAVERGTAGGALIGGAEGAVGTSLGEGIGAVVNYAKSAGVERARRQVQQIDAKAVGQAIEQNPKLQGVFAGYRSAEELRNLALGTTTDASGKPVNIGLKLIQDYQEQSAQRIQQILQKRRPQGAVFADPQEPTRFVPWTEAKASLSELGQKAFSGAKGNPLEPTMAGMDLREAYAKGVRDLQKTLTMYDPSGQALKAFNDGQGVYEAGRYQLKVLRAAFRQKEADRIAFNSDKLYGKLGDEQVVATKKLGPEGYNLLINSRPGNQPGLQDVFEPKGALAKISEIMPLPGPAYARMRIGRPELVGNPLGLAPATRRDITSGIQSVTGNVLDPMAQGLDLQSGLPIK